MVDIQLAEHSKSGALIGLNESKRKTNSVCVCVGAPCGDMLIGSGYSIAGLTIAEITEKKVDKAPRIRIRVVIWILLSDTDLL